MDMLTLMQAQRAAFDAELPVSLAIRKDRLTRAIRMMVDHAEAFCAALSADFGHRSREQSMLTDVISSIRTLKHARKHLDRWARPERRKLDFPLGLLGARASVEYQPKGVIGVIAPWNFPIQLTMGPLAGILAAGNRAMVKSSEFTPRTAALFEQVAGDYCDPTELIFVSGGADVGRAFSALPFDHLIFTGATGIGKHILHAAADNLVPVTLELGGKSPVILCDDYPLGKAARSIAFGKFLNAGQTCIAPDYVLVPEHKAEALADALLAEVRRSYPDPGADPDYSGVISDRHRSRLQGAIDKAREGGATILSHGEEAAAAAGKIAPTIVLGATEDTILASEEIFGPVLPIVPYHRLEDAIHFVQQRDRPLALYCFTRDRGRERHVLDRTVSGGATVNGTLLHIAQESLPFGGVGPSGIGAYHGVEGFKRFSHPRGVFRAGPFIAFERLGPPWGNLARRMARAILKR